MSQKKPRPLYRSPRRKHCPVCGEVTFSRSGIHPQCAVKQADNKRLARLKSKKKPAKKSSQNAAQSASSAGLKAWHKRCPKCQAQVHVRKASCLCGYTFAPKAPSSSGDR